MRRGCEVFRKGGKGASKTRRKEETIGKKLKRENKKKKTGTKEARISEKGYCVREGSAHKTGSPSQFNDRPSDEI